MGSHISTEDTFFIEAPVVKMKCFMCGNTCDHELGWVGARCSYCKCVWNMEEFYGDIVKRRREKMGFNRPQMAKIIGLSKHTIKRYEYIRCSRPYFKKTLRMYRKFLKQNQAA